MDNGIDYGLVFCAHCIPIQFLFENCNMMYHSVGTIS